MDSELRQLLTSTISVRRPSATSSSGSSETLAAAVSLPCCYEQRTRYVPAAKPERVTENWVTIDHTDVAASALAGVLRDTDRMWVEGKDPTDPTFGVKPKSVESFKDPETLAISHWEVML